MQHIRHAAGIRVSQPRSTWFHDSSSLIAPELAVRLNVPVNWLYVQIKQKRVRADQQYSRAYFFQDSPAVLDAVRASRNHRTTRRQNRDRAVSGLRVRVSTSASGKAPSQVLRAPRGTE